MSQQKVKFQNLQNYGMNQRLSTQNQQVSMDYQERSYNKSLPRSDTAI